MRQASRQQPAAHSAESTEPFRTSRRRLLAAAGAGAIATTVGQSLAGTARVAFAQDSTGDGIAVFPGHQTRTASPYTEISFRGATEEELGQVTVIGSISGGHSGLFMPHSDGTGVSFVPDSRFEPGEEITVVAERELAPTADGSLTFGVVRPAVVDPAPTSKVRDNPEAPTHAFQSRPDLHPPVMEVTVPADGSDDGYIFFGARVSDGQAGAMIMDDSGEIVWYEPAPNDLDERHDLRVQEYQGEPVITFAEANGPRGYRRGHFAICDNSYQPVAAFQIGNGFAGGDHHELLLTPRGTALVGCYHSVIWDATPVGGLEESKVIDYVVQEIDVEAGRVLFEWHSLDHVALDESYSSLPEDEDGTYDYIHVNSIDEGPDGNLLISGRHTYAIYKIDRATGEVAWRLNGKQSDFEMGDGTPFAYQHDARFQPNGQVSLFDNKTNSGDADVVSRGLVLDLDMDAMTATLAHEYVHPDEVVSGSQANTQLLPNGNVFVGWGSAPNFTEFTQDGEIVYDGRFSEGGSSYRAYRFPWTGMPSEPPAVATEAGVGSVTAYASWNGATEVASWQVLAGPSPDQLEPAGSGERDGFETEISVETSEAYVAVEALDADGNVLGTSEAVEV